MNCTIMALKAKNGGVRRFENNDESLTEEGKERYNKKQARQQARKERRERNKRGAKYLGEQKQIEREKSIKN